MGVDSSAVAIVVRAGDGNAPMKFVIFVIDDATNSGNPDEMNAIDEFNDSLRKNGHWVFACGIGAPSTASLIDGRDGHAGIESGSLFRERDFYSGLWVIDAENEERATELARRGSAACNRRVELRPLL